MSISEEICSEEDCGEEVTEDEKMFIRVIYVDKLLSINVGWGDTLRLMATKSNATSHDERIEKRKVIKVKIIFLKIP